MRYLKSALVGLLLTFAFAAFAQDAIYVSQIGFDNNGPKIAVVGTAIKFQANKKFTIVDVNSRKTVFTGVLGPVQQVEDWYKNRYFYQADFSGLHTNGKFQIVIKEGYAQLSSNEFNITQY